MNKILFIFLLKNIFVLLSGRVVLPNVPDVLYPPVPESINLPSDYLLNEDDPELTPGLFQGDMAMDNNVYKYLRVGIRWDVFPEKLWTNRTVPYVISPLYEADDRITIYQAIRTINFMTCVNFVPWNGKTKDYLLIWPVKSPKGCWSHVGKAGGAQILSLQPPDDDGPHCLKDEGRPLHELMHALGIFHEHSRNDRDRFIKIHWSNIRPEYRDNFEKKSTQNSTYSFEYDYDSIMHYKKSSFSINKDKPTISAKMKNVKFGQRKALSKTDCLKINDLYQCLDDDRLKYKYYTLCRVLGL